MTQERIELRFNPGNPEENALLEALEAQGGEYGGKGRFLKARLLLGYVAIMRELASIQQEHDPLSALDRLARSVSSGHYRVLRELLCDRPVVTQGVMTEPYVSPMPTEAKALSLRTEAIEARSLPDAPIAMVIEVPTLEVVNSMVAPDNDVEKVDPASSVVVPAANPNWASRFASIAGKKEE